MPLTFTDIFPPPYDMYLITYFIPFILLFAIFWGLLSGMKIFGRRINTFLALIFPVVFILGAPETFLWFSNYLISLGSFLAVGAFVTLFIFGTIRWAFGRGRDIYRETGDYEKLIKKKSEELEKCRQKAEQATSDADRANWAEKYQQIKTDIDMLKMKRNR